MIPLETSHLGYVFLILGLSFAIMGYVLYLNLHGKRQSLGKESDADRDHPPGLPTASIAKQQPERSGGNSSEKASSGEVLMGNAEDPSSQAEEKTQDDELSQLSREDEISLLRDPESGHLAIRVGDQTYRSPEGLKSSEHSGLVKGFLADLATWFPSISEEPGWTAIAETYQEDLQDQTRGMVDEINAILKEKLHLLPERRRGVSLIADHKGNVKVIVGVEIFPIDELPHEDVRDLINQCVAEWEKTL